MSPTLALSLFWFFYFAGIGVHFPYFSLYLRENAGLSAAEVGIVLASWPLVGVLCQPFWGYVADRTGRRSTVLGLLAAGAGIGFFSQGVVTGFLPLLAATAATALFGTAVVPMLFSISFGALQDAGPRAIGFTRVWGTIGFLILVETFPWWLHRRQQQIGVLAVAGGPSEPGLGIMFPVVAACIALATLVTAFFPRSGLVAQSAARGQWRKLLRHGPLLRLTAFTMLGYLFTQGPMVLFPVWVRAHGGDIDTVGRMWVLMIALEIPLVLLAGSGLRRLGVRSLLVVGTLAAGARWLACALVDDLALIYAAQLLHGITVAGLMLGSPMYLDRIVPGELRSSGQTFVSMLSTGLGGVLSTVASGWLMEFGGSDAPYLVGGIGALALGCAAGWILPPLPAAAPGATAVARD